MSEEKITVIDIQNCILGRVLAKVSKKLLLGENIALVNCYDVLILGKKEYLVTKYKDKLQNKVIKQGPYYSRVPCDMVKRSIRNMLPYKNQRGVLALKRLKCYNKVPSTLINSEKLVIDSSKMNSSTSLYHTKMLDLCRILGYKN